jgi:hypothetical protein
VIAMTTTIIARRFFDDEDQADKNVFVLPTDTASLKKMGMIRVQGIIPIGLNDRLKTMARSKGKNTDVVIGELIQSATADIDKWEAQQVAQQLRQQFGDQWLEILRSAEP